MERCLRLIQSNIEKELVSNIKSECQGYHNHPPVRFTVPNCPYCNKYGNIFSMKGK
jgi:hypothetical protein